VAHLATIRELFEEAGVLGRDVGVGGHLAAPDPRSLPAATLADLASTLIYDRTDLLVPLTLGDTTDLSRRFDTRFFAAALPDDVEPSFEETRWSPTRGSRPPMR
jgi:8-oxo-dGTP pyrophosphatase MutT (NUDIX family)